MSNLIAYIPVFNRRHLDWLCRHKMSDLFLITQGMAEEFVPRLVRNIVAVPTETMIQMIQPMQLLRSVTIFDPDFDDPNLRNNRDWIMPDEDISHALAEKYLLPAGCNVTFESIWARYDMQVVKAQEPVIADVELSEREFDRCIMRMIGEKAGRSPDWWRQVGAAAVGEGGKILATAANAYQPTEYEADAMGDPALNFDAKEKKVSLVLHAERTVISECARTGRRLEGSFLYVTTFPCEDCARAIAVAGVRKVFFREGYSTKIGQEVFRAAKIQVVRVA